MKPTIKKLNTYLQARVPQIQVVRGNGYFYFADSDDSPICVNLPESIYVCYLNHLTLEQWHLEMDQAVAQFEKDNSELVAKETSINE
tara:strand:+ start:853 stop:1113 length:261 start_codon:yes stop_codon:yes gene_type:complete